MTDWMICRSSAEMRSPGYANFLSDRSDRSDWSDKRAKHSMARDHRKCAYFKQIITQFTELRAISVV